MTLDIRSLIIVEDNPADATHYMRLLENVDHDFHHIEHFQSISGAEERINQQPTPTCCLLDFNLPDGSALNLIENLQSDSNTTACPFVVITGQEDTQSAVKLLQSGVQNYLIKHELESEQLIRVINNAIRTWELQQQLNHLALHDPLTGLTNRALFMDRLVQLFEESKRYKRPFGLLYIDLDHFKLVNDTYGHDAGDYLLKSIATALKTALRNTDTCARLGGDEFAVLLPEIDEKQAHHVTSKLVEALAIDLPWQETYISTSPSIGLATYPSRAKCHEDLMREADLALYQAKKNGRGQYAIFNKVMDSENRHLNLLSSALPRALLNLDLQIAYQPIVDIEKEEIIALEALVRWNFKEQWVSPEKIIELVIERRLNEPFHRWLFSSALEQLAQWQQSRPELELCINLPANLCHDTKLSGSLSRLTREYSINPEKITVEVTETHLIQYPKETKQQLVALADEGFKIAIDDFGSGYSSMQYLASLPCSTLKIDKQFFLELHSNSRNIEIIEAMTALAHRLRLNVVAEGIETEILLKSAKKFGCDRAQGYWLGAPTISHAPFDDFCYESKLQGEKFVINQ